MNSKEPIRIEFRIDRTSARRAIVVGGTLTLLAVAGVGLAVPVPVANTYATGKPLTQADLDANFNAVETRLSALEKNLPPGTIVPYGGQIDKNPGEGTGAPVHPPPAGWLLCDGMQLNGISPAYSALYGAIGVSFGGNRTSQSFNLPDLRGMFLRGVDDRSVDKTPLIDLDVAKRTATKTGGNQGANAGSFEPAAFLSHFHSITDKPHHHSLGHQTFEIPPNGASGAFCFGTNGIDNNPPTNDTMTGITQTNGESAGGGSETRPVNVAVYYIIKL